MRRRWGAEYDRNDYAGFVIPRKIRAAVNTVADVANIGKLNASENPQFKEALEAARIIREALPDRGVIQAIFSPLSVLPQLADLPLYPSDTYSNTDLTVQQVIFNQPDLAKQALANIADTLADYARLLVTPISEGGVGLSGIFYAVTGTVSEGYFDRAQYREFSEPYDHIVIDAVRKANPDWFDDLGVDIIHWNQYSHGNPKADADLDAVPVAGANYLEFAPDGSVEQVRAELDETIRLRGDKPFLLAPSCTMLTPSSDEALELLAQYRVA
ncbi:uroporphyrinogen decarboxylase [Bifidobacterium animalis subsp. animalis]|uniref:uroporphyrinogen decarboxylase family protein n=1 Tax=Bifidobacterium animalis TaxID=28025 RepID=UPI0010EE63B6|nr:uroporphyrinogen decarboxylase family protein [Bifidobacterium animalis]RYN14873.1 uroporphyrinogen decarboxylase [Bifidobacterium animalis subsp. animalis]